MVGMFVSLCLASKKSSKREFFVPAGTGLGDKLLNEACRIDELSRESVLGLKFSQTTSTQNVP
jgi:hypothetical protein